MRGSYLALRRALSILCAVLLVLTLAARQTNAQYKHLHDFSGSEGATPYGTLIADANGYLYGTTFLGGPWNAGVIYRMDTAGNMTVLHALSITDGDAMYAGLVLQGTTLYGCAVSGGPYQMGTLFKLQTNGSGFQVLHNFNYSDGANPEGTLDLSGKILYGTCTHGGPNGGGTVFSIHTDGSAFQIIHSFTGVANSNGQVDGLNPTCSLLQVGRIFFGTTYYGGAYGNGVVWRVNTDGTGFEILHAFDGMHGAWPLAGVILYAGQFYGTTQIGGTSGGGVIFSMGTNGSHFSVLKNLDASTGTVPAANLIVYNNELYGTTYTGPPTGGPYNGTIFEIRPNGTGFTVLYGGGVSGEQPYAALLPLHGLLYGVMAGGGAYGLGTAFSISP